MEYLVWIWLGAVLMFCAGRVTGEKAGRAQVLRAAYLHTRESNTTLMEEFITEYIEDGNDIPTGEESRRYISEANARVNG